jgi:hypothetical protein
LQARAPGLIFGARCFLRARTDFRLL